MSRDIVKDFKRLGIDFDIPDMMSTRGGYYVEFRVHDEDYNKASEWAEEKCDSFYNISVTGGLPK